MNSCSYAVQVCVHARTHGCLDLRRGSLPPQPLLFRPMLLRLSTAPLDADMHSPRAVLHKLASDAMGKVQYIMGGDEAGVKLRASRSVERTAVTATLWVGLKQYSIAAQWNRQVCSATMSSVV